MLRRIAILNSKIFAKAEIILDDCDSIQLVGGNNVGKSTLIYALNFLFVYDSRNMNFSGERKFGKETVEHYFPSPTQSFIIFEIFKQGYYCIIIKRDVDFNLEYYCLESEYKESHYLEEQDGKIQMKKFEDVQIDFLRYGLTFEKFKEKSDTFSKIYQRGKRNNAVVWLEDTVKATGLSNNFTKIYRYLINTKLINNNTLKESLIIADNRENETLNFSGRDRNDLNKLKRLNEEIKTLNEIREEFFQFRNIVDKCSGKTRIAGEIKYSFNKGINTALQELDKLILNKGIDVQKLSVEINETLIPRRDGLNQQIGEITGQVKSIELEIANIEKTVKQIDSTDPIDFLKQSIENKNNERKDLEYKLSHIKHHNLFSQKIENRIVQLKKQIAQIDSVVNNFDSLLIHNISDKNEIKHLLNSILSDSLLNLPKTSILKRIENTTENLNLYDGIISLPKNLELKPIKTIQDFQKDKDELNSELIEQEDLLKLAKDFEIHKEKLSTVEKEIELIKDKIKLIESRPILISKKEELLETRNKKSSEKIRIEADIKNVKEEIERKEEALKMANSEKNRFENRKRDYLEYQIYFNSLLVPEIPNESLESIEQLYTKLKLNEEGENGRIFLIINKNNQFDRLKTKLNRLEADEQQFIKTISEELACISEKEKSIETLLQSISNQFAVPASKLLNRFDDFKKFVYNKFNSTLGKTQISDIKELKIELIENRKLIDELKQIKAIQNYEGKTLLQFDQSENLKTLNQYLDNQKQIQFYELFDIKLKINVKGEERFVDLKNQVESDGTDRMIRLVFIMLVINKLVVNDKENRVALFIDEVATIDKNNRPELVKFCNAHNFIPIFAAPEPVSDFNKYYFIRQSNQGGKIFISESKNVMRSERN